MFSPRFWYAYATITIMLAVHLGHFSAQSQDSRTVVRLSIPGTDTVYSTPYRIAQERGFYRDEKVELQILGGVENRPQRSDAGRRHVEATQTVGPTTLAAIVRGAPLKIVMVFNDKPSYWLYSKKNVRSFADLKGANVASSTPGSTNDRLLKIVLEKKGLNWRKDVTIVYIGTADVRLKALLTGSVDAAVLTLPGNLLAKDSGFVELASFEGEVGALTGGIATSDPFLTNKRNVAVRFLRATLKGLKFFNSDRDGAVRIMAKYMNIPYEAALRTYDTSIPVFVSDGLLSEDFQDRVLDFEFNAMGMEKKLSRNKVFDFSIMKSLATK